MKKLNAKGFAHQVLILALIVVAVIGGIGSYIYLRSSSAMVPSPDGGTTVTNASIGTKYSATVSVYPKPKAGVTSTYTVKVTNSSSKYIYIGRHTLAVDRKPVTTSSGGLFFGGTTSSTNPRIGVAAPNKTTTFKFSLTSPASVSGHKIYGVTFQPLQITSSGAPATDKYGNYHPLAVRAYAY